MTAGGYVRLHRRIREHPLWERKPFSDGQAFVDLVLRAAFREHAVRHGRPQRRGEIVTSQLELSEAWGWDRKRVRKLLRELAAEGTAIVITNKNRKTGGTRILLTNYERYQADASDHETVQKAAQSSPSNAAGEPPPDSPSIPHQLPTTEEGKEEKRISRRPNGWALWVDACRESGKPDPLRLGKNTAAAKNILTALNGDAAEFKRVCKLYLADCDSWLVERGHALCFLTSKLEGYRNAAHVNDAAFFASADAAALEFCNRQRKADA